MGKAIVIPGVNWATNNLGTVSPCAFYISGNTTVRPTGTFSAIYNNSAVNASWSLSNTSIASLSSDTGTLVTVTALSAGTVTLTATYDNNTISLDLEVDTVTVITEADITSDMLRYVKTTDNKTRTCIPLDIENTNSFTGSISCSSSSVKVAIQFWDDGYTEPSSDSSNPGQTQNTTHIVWDSGWITQGMSSNFSYANNKNNTIGGAQSDGPAVKVVINTTYVSGNSGMPTLLEIQSACDFYFEP